jgi:hypothetical protein
MLQNMHVNKIRKHFYFRPLLSLDATHISVLTDRRATIVSIGRQAQESLLPDTVTGRSVEW